MRYLLLLAVLIFLMVKSMIMAKRNLLILFLLVMVGCTSKPTVVDLGEAPSNIDPEFQWPVHGAAITQSFRPKKRSPYRRIHQGIDLAAPKNTPILAIDHGIVRYAGHGKTGYGRLVVIEHLDKKYQSYYAHLNRYKVERGDIVRKGDVVGLMGRSGRATGVHLHFELRKNKVAVNPLDYLPTEATSSQQAKPQP